MISPTSLSAYVQCPYYYYLIYYLKIKTLSDQYGMLGSSGHKVLEKFWSYYIELGDVDKALQESINRWWDINIIPEFNDVANNIFNNFSKRIKEDSTLPEFVEQKISSDTYNTICVVDVIHTNKIIDYKTSTQYTVRPKINNIIQGIICCLNTEEAYRYPIEKAEFWYLRLNKTQEVLYTPENIDLVLNLKGRLEDSIKEEYFPKNIKSCGHCYYKVICDKQEKFIRRKLDGI